MRLPFYFFTLIIMTTTEQPQTEKNQAIPVDFNKVFISGVEDPKAVLRRPVDDIPLNKKVRAIETRVRDEKVNETLNPREEILSRSWWSDCDDLDKEPSFHPRIVIGVSWVPVYAWTLDGVDNFVHKFSVPTAKSVEYYKKTYGPYVKIDWSQPKMILRLMIAEKLLISVGRRGRFKVIEKFVMPGKVPPDFYIPVTTVQLKLNGRYLAMMCCDCNRPYTVVLGDHHSALRSTQEKIKAGLSFGIIGWGAPVTYDAGEEKRFWRAKQNQEAEMMQKNRKKSEVLESDVLYDENRDIKDTVLSTGILLNQEILD